LSQYGYEKEKEKKKNSPFGKKSGGANRFYFRIEGNLFF